jgi:sugar transferase (PEP-CTERM/EpsH1 system associated)
MIYAREGRRLLELEQRIVREFSATMLVSRPEVDLFRQLTPDCTRPVYAVPNGVDADYFSPARPCENPFDSATTPIVFVGAMDYWPNADAVAWFVRGILPRLVPNVPNVHFTVVGSNPGIDVLRLRSCGVTVTGRVADVRPYLGHAAAVVAPLRVARGVQNKVLEAMAMAKVVVATPQALDGIDAEPGAHLRIAADERAFAAALLQAVVNEENRTIGQRARQLVQARYDWTSSLAQIDAILENSAPAHVHRHSVRDAPDAGHAIQAAACG